MTESRVDLIALPAADETFVLSEDEFRLLYDRTSRPLWVYLYRLTRDAPLADDLLQDTYYRFLRASAPHDGEQHERNTLYRIATNLARDSRRRARPTVPLDATHGASFACGAEAVHGAGDRADVHKAMARLRDRDQQLLWLAYAEGSSHDEIAASLGLRPTSVKTLLFRARQRLARLLPQTMRGSAR